MDSILNTILNIGLFKMIIATALIVIVIRIIFKITAWLLKIALILVCFAIIARLIFNISFGLF